MILAAAIAAAALAWGSPPGAAAEPGTSASFRAWLGGDAITGSGFGGPVRITITDRTTNPATVTAYPWENIEDDGTGGFNLFLDAREQASPWRLRPGNVIRVVGPAATRTLKVADLRIAAFDLRANTVSGTSNTPGIVTVEASRPGSQARVASRVTGARWSADFDAAEPAFDLRVMDGARAMLPDADGDSTVVGLRALAPPRFGFSPELQQVIGYDWPDGATVALRLDRPETPVSPDYGTTAIAGADASTGTTLSTGDGNVRFTLAGGPSLVLPGDVLTMTDGTTTKTQVIPDLRVDLPDVEAGLVSGSTTGPLPAGSFLVVGQDAPTHDGAVHEVTPAVDGTWSQSFAADDGLGAPGDRSPWANQVDEDGDSTGVNAPDPTLTVDPAHDRVWATDLAPGPVTLTVTRDGALLDTVTVQTRTIYADGCPTTDLWTSPRSALDRPTAALFDLAGRTSLMAGDILAVTDGVSLLEITVDELAVDGANPLTDTVTGTAEGPVTLRLGDGCGVDPGHEAEPIDGSWTYWFNPATFEVPPEGLTPGQVVWVTGAGGSTRIRTVVGPDPVFGGILAPLSERPVINTMPAGRAVEVRFSLGGDYSLDIFAPGAPWSQRIPAVPGEAVPVGRTVRATASSLRYEALSGQYVFTWATDPAWAGTSRQLVLSFRDGTQVRLDFALTR